MINLHRLALAAPLLLLLQIPAYSQMDLSGEWSPRQHHDQLQRGDRWTNLQRAESSCERNEFR